jgi:hypothetical protein
MDVFRGRERAMRLNDANSAVEHLESCLQLEAVRYKDVGLALATLGTMLHKYPSRTAKSAHFPKDIFKWHLK